MLQNNAQLLFKKIKLCSKSCLCNPEAVGIQELNDKPSVGAQQTLARKKIGRYKALMR